jgi:phospholipid/cholesterol/gamma-HCH transport system substrate-binding protein
MGKNYHALTAGLFLLTLIAAAIVAIYWIGNWNEKRNLYVISTRVSVSGLNPESTVFYRGIAVGKVLSVAFDQADAGIILVPIEIDKDIVLTKGVYANLRLKGVTGLTQIQLEDDGSNKTILMPGNDPKTRIPMQPSATDRLMDSGEALLKKADHLMLRLNSLLNDENEKNIVGILTNLKMLSDKLGDLQNRTDQILQDIPALNHDARKALAHFDALTLELAALAGEMKKLSVQTGAFIDTGAVAGDHLVQTTLPKINKMVTELQAAARQIKRTADDLDNNPQSLLLGPDQSNGGPGEPGYREPK